MVSSKFSKKLHVGYLLLVMAFLCPLATGKTIYVDDDAVGADDGTSWDNALSRISEGMVMASEGDEIWVAESIYYEHIMVKRGVALYGGFVGTETQREQRDWTLNETVLDGSGVGPVVAFENDAAEETRFDGFTVRNGIHRNLSFTAGGIACCDSSPTVANNTITGNSGTWAGGIMCRNSNAIILQNVLSGNDSVNSGGAIQIESGAGQIEDCTPKIIENTISNNSSPNGAGICCMLSSPVITGNTITENEAGEGAGIAFYRAYGTTSKNRIFNNHASKYGGAILCKYSSDPLILDNSITGNTSDERGGAIACMPRWDQQYPSNPVIKNNIISGNDAAGGAGIWCEYSEPVISNNTIVGHGYDNLLNGAAIHCVGLEAKIINCIIWNNEAWDLFGCTATYSCVRRQYPLWNENPAGEGNIYTDPCFASPGHLNDNGTWHTWADDFWVDGEDYHLKSQAERWDPNSESWVIDDVTSPCIDAGDPNSPVAFEPFPNGIIVNMGAYGGTVEASKATSGFHAQYGGGIGEPDDAYLIYTAAHLNVIGSRPDDWEKHFKLMADIDLSGYTYDRAVIAPDMDDGNESFDGNAFAGGFDGNGHVISHLTISGKSYLGLFGRIDGVEEVKDVALLDVNITGSGDDIGSLAGDNFGRIVHCFGSGMIKGNWWVGGLIGFNAGRITASYSTATIDGWCEVGGLVGLNGNNGSVTECYSASTVNASGDVGGLIGFNNGLVRNCYSSSAVRGGMDIGGLVGYHETGSIVNSHSFGKVSGDDIVGGLVGDVLNGHETGCFWSTETSGQTTSACGIGKTTVEMQSSATFLETGWDFTDEVENGTKDIWWIDDGKNYPRLRWEES